MNEKEAREKLIEALEETETKMLIAARSAHLALGHPGQLGRCGDCQMYLHQVQSNTALIEKIQKENK